MLDVDLIAGAGLDVCCNDGCDRGRIARLTHASFCFSAEWHLVITSIGSIAIPEGA